MNESTEETMLLRWIKNITNQGSKESGDFAQTGRPKGVDVAERALEYQAASYKKKELDGLIKKGWPAVKRERLRSKIKQTVWDKVLESSVPADDEMIEEITDKIADAAENDPLYKRIFGG